MRRMSHHLRSNLVGYIALFVALGGTSYAAVNLPTGSVGNRQIRNHSITPIKFDPSKITGSVRYWAVVDGSGRVLESSKPRPKTSGFVSGEGAGVINWGPIRKPCVPVVYVDDQTPGFASAKLAGEVLVQTFSPTGQPAARTVIVMLLCSA
jgi:hypothetical protein